MSGCFLISGIAATGGHGDQGMQGKRNKNKYEMIAVMLFNMLRRHVRQTLLKITYVIKMLKNSVLHRIFSFMSYRAKYQALVTDLQTDETDGRIYGHSSLFKKELVSSGDLGLKLNP